MSDLRHFSADDIQARDPRDVFDAVQSALAMVSSGDAVAPVRAHVPMADGVDAYMISGALPKLDLFTVKVINVVPGNPRHGLERLQGSLTAFELSTGRPLATLDARAATQVRTAACSAVSMRLLARADADVLTVFGVGPQSKAHVRALSAEWEFREVRVAGRDDDPARCLDGAGVVVTATNSVTPLFRASDVPPGAHVIAIGSGSANAAELEPELLAQATVFVDHKPTCIEEAGEIVQALAQDTIKKDDVHELGELILGRVGGRRKNADITVYKSVGNGTQDAALAALLLGRVGAEA